MAATRYYLAQSLGGYLAEADGGIDWLEGYQGVADLAGTELLEGTATSGSSAAGTWRGSSRPTA